MLLTKQLDKLTENHLRTLEATRIYWRSVALSLRGWGEADCIEGLKLAYRAAGLNAPSIVISLKSPRAGSTAVRLLHSDIDWPASLTPPQKDVWDEVWKQSVRPVERLVGPVRWSELRRRFKKDAEETVLKKHGCLIEKSVKEHFAEQMGIWIWRYLRENAGHSTFGAIRTEIEESVQAQIYAQVSPEVQKQVYRDLRLPLRQECWSAIGEPVRQSLAVNNGILAGRQNLDCGFGHLDSDWIAFYQFFAAIGIKGTEPLEGIKKLAESCGWWWPYRNICFATGRPAKLQRDNRGRLHSETGMALRYADNWGFYAWNGIIVPKYVVLLPEPITLEMIHAEPNTEVRRILIERFGLDNYVKNGAVQKLHKDQTGTLYKMNVAGDEPIFFVQVVNSTPEPDGIYKEYFLRVPPTMMRAREAVAWTFGLTEEEYMPLIQT